MKKSAVWFLVAIFCCARAFAAGNEVLGESKAEVFVREHPQTGKPFVCIRKGTAAVDPFKGFVKRDVRPDYRMLDANVKPKDVGYDGPVSDRKKVYIFAGTMMTLGVAGGIVTAAMPATAAAAGAGSGTTAVLGTGTAVATAVAADIVVESQIKPGEEHYVHDSKTMSATGDPKNLSFREVLRRIDAEGSPSEV